MTPEQYIAFIRQSLGADRPVPRRPRLLGARRRGCCHEPLSRGSSCSRWRCAGCESTSSTEVGVRTCLFGILEKRGEQQVYPPGGIYLVMPFVNSWDTLPISQQNLLMNANPDEGDRPVPDDITFKTKDGNNVYIDVNVMWRINPEKRGRRHQPRGALRRRDQGAHRAARLALHHPRRLQRDHQRGVLPRRRSRTGWRPRPREQLDEGAAALTASSWTCCRCSSTASTRSTRRPSTRRSRPRRTCRRCWSSRRTSWCRSSRELQAKRAEWNQKLEDARGRGRPHPQRGGRLLPDKHQRGQGAAGPGQGRGGLHSQGGRGAQQAGGRRVREDAARPAVLRQAHHPGARSPTSAP